MNKKHQKNYIYIGLLAGTLVLFGFFFYGYQKETILSQSDIKKLLSVQDFDYKEGAVHAQVTLIEYLDFECEACRAYFPIIQELKIKFKDELKIVYRYFPLPGHKNSMTAALSVEAAGRQGKFSEMKDILFLNQKEWGEKEFANKGLFYEYAEKIELDMQKFKADIENSKLSQRVMLDKSGGNALGVKGTPSFFLNGEKIYNPRTLQDFETLIKAEILKFPKDVGVKVHEHADIKVYLDNKMLDLGQVQYQSTDKKSLDVDTHLHDGNGNNIHKHRTKKTIGDLFRSIGIAFTDTCFTLETGKKYCNEGAKTLKLFVNGKENSLFGDYELADLDRILITFGNNTPEEILMQQRSVTDQACMYSEKCPERGKPPTESCAVGLGGDC